MCIIKTGVTVCKMTSVKLIYAFSGFGCCQFLGGGSFVVDSLLIVATIILWGILDPCFVVHYFVSFLVLQLSCWEIESWLLYIYCLLI